MLLTGLVLFPRASRYAWSSWERGSLREAGEHGTSGHTRPQRRDWAQRQEGGVWWVREGDRRGDMGSPGGTKVCAQCLEKPGTFAPGHPGLGLTLNFPTLAEFP